MQAAHAVDFVARVRVTLGDASTLVKASILEGSGFTYSS